MKNLTVPDEIIINKIYLIRNQKVMIDRDLAELYGLETKRLKEAVRRNILRFPDDFMFEMSTKEMELWKNHIEISSDDKKGLRHVPFCFTEQGVTMLSCILNSDKAIEVNIRIIRIFTRFREMISTHKDILMKLEEIEKKLAGHNDDIQLIFSALKQLISNPPKPRKQIGYKVNNKQ